MTGADIYSLEHDTTGAIRLAATQPALTFAPSACGGQATSGERSTPTASSSATASETTKVVAEATPQQVAGLPLIAGAESDWREVIDKAGECRFTWTMSEGDPVDQANGMACYMRESTIGYTAQTARDELTALAVPASMTALVDETDAGTPRRYRR